MLPPELFLNIDREVELFRDLLTVKQRRISPTSGYHLDHLYVRGYIEDQEEPTEHTYYHDMLLPSIEALTKLLNNVSYIEFEKPPICKPTEGPAQVLGGSDELGFYLRKTTEYKMFGVLGDQCPEHVAKPEFDGWFGSDDECPDDCKFEPKFKGLKPGYQTIYDVLVRTNPKMNIQ